MEISRADMTAAIDQLVIQRMLALKDSTTNFKNGPMGKLAAAEKEAQKFLEDNDEPDVNDDAPEEKKPRSDFGPGTGDFLFA